MAWKDKVDMDIKAHLEKQVKETLKYKNAYLNAKNPADAQLWCAVAGLSKQLFDINLKLTYLERALKDIGAKKVVKRKVNKRKTTRRKKK